MPAVPPAREELDVRLIACGALIRASSCPASPRLGDAVPPGRRPGQMQREPGFGAAIAKHDKDTSM